MFNCIPLEHGEATLVLTYMGRCGLEAVNLSFSLYIFQVYRKNWMFKLVGSEVFHIGKKAKVAEIMISSKGMSFEYVLTVDGKPLEKFVQAQAKNTRTWLPVINGTDHRVVLGKSYNLSLVYSIAGACLHV